MRQIESRAALEILTPPVAPGDPHLLAPRDVPDLELVEMTDWQRAPGSNWSEARNSAHFVQFYDSDGFLLDAVSDYVATAIRAGDAGVVIATPEHLAGVRVRLNAAGLDSDAAQANGCLHALDAADTLASFTVDGNLDAGRFAEVIGGVLARASMGDRRVCAFGEMVALLAADGDSAGAVQLERLWNELQQTVKFSLFCAYPMQQFGADGTRQLLEDVCAEHEHVIPAESYTELTTQDDRLRAITLLQQKARRLETEIAERERAEEQLRAALASERAARQDAEVALRVRDEFLAIAAHELRTPLTGLSGHVQLMQRQLKRHRELAPERVEQVLHAIGGQADKLARLLTQLLDVSRIDAGKLAIESEPTDIVALLEQVVADAQARDERHVVTLTTPASLHGWVDPLRLEQVLINLIDNAGKHSPDGADIAVTLTQLSDAHLELAVRDRGPGIPPANRGQIFERYFQAHAQGHRSGLGLGLYISRQIVELHGGRISAEFPADGGTRIVARMPLGVARACAAD
jgi:signal transduction histidine kinase